MNRLPLLAAFALLAVAAPAAAVDTATWCYVDVTPTASIPVRSRCDVGPYREIGTCMRSHCEGEPVLVCQYRAPALTARPTEASCTPHVPALP